MVKKIEVAQLKPGMFIHDFNCGWLQHPFFSKSIKIKDNQIIEKVISNGIREVYIDTDKGLDVADAQTQEEVNQEIEAEIKEDIDPDLEERNIIPVQEEIVKAKQFIKEANQTARNVMEDVKFGRQLEMEKVHNTVENMLESILRNKDALIYLGKIKQNDEYTFVHSVNVCVLIMAFGKYLGFDHQTITDIGVGGLLHDIGKMKLPTEILNKKGPLSEDEFTQVKEHVKYGRIILEQTPDIDENSLDVVTQHHERWDGTGYPKRLNGGEINMFGQMAAIVDVYDAITSDRCYKNKIMPTEALKKLYEWSKFHFNRVLVQRFIRCMGIYPVGTLVRLESGLLGVVLNHDEKSLLQPVVRIIYDTKKEVKIMPRDIDLSLSEDKVISYENPEIWFIKPEKYL